VPHIAGNAALDVLIGLFFLYFLLSIVCSAVNEAVASYLNLRAIDLERGVQNLLGKERTERFFEHWRVKMLWKPPGIFLKKVRKPSYIPAHVFATTLIDILHAPGEPPPTTDGIRDRFAEATAALENVKDEPALHGLLQDAVTNGIGYPSMFFDSLETSFNDVMERASGWYKRRIQIILFAVAFALVCAINADSFAIGQRLWKDDALRAAVVAQANQAVSSNNASCQSSTGKPEASSVAPTTKAADCVNQVKALGLPLGWSSATSPHSVTSGIGKALGLLVTIFALSLGAPFWFDLLGKVANLRSAGAPPPPATSTNAPVTTN
jgi:hypothetical protein